MQFLSDRTRSESCNGSQNDSESFEPVVGWEFQEENLDSVEKIISAANKLLHLDIIFNKYSIKFEPTYNQVGWSFKCLCPFDDHNDRAPSFGYNPSENRFNCFGCNRAGQSVEFLSYKEGKSRIEIAREIIRTTSNDYSILPENNTLNYEELQSILFEFADFVREFKRKHAFSTKALKYSEAVNWNLDVYLCLHIPANSVVLADLCTRISKLKHQLNLFKESY